MIGLPAVAFALFFLAMRKRGVETRRAYLAAATFCGTAVVLITESLSVAKLVTRGGVAMWWVGLCVVGLIAYLRPATANTHLKTQRNPAEPADGLDQTTMILLAGSGLIILLVAITGLLAPPSGVDAMSYHMSRVSMWINNHNVAFYPTPDYTQLIYGAFAEYSIMHTLLLWGSDRLTSVVQLFSMIGCAIAVSYIVKLLGGSRRAQALAAVISITIPEGILEASGPKNMYSTSFWMATTTAFLLASNENPSWLNTICIGLAAGLAIFTKGTAYVMLPFIVLACWWIGSGPARMRLAKRGAVVAGLILAVNLAQYVRNYQFVGSPLGASLNYGELQLTVEGIGIKSTVANILRNFALQIGTPSQSLNLKIEQGFRKAIEVMGTDPDDSRQVVFAKPFGVNHMSFNEFLAGNPFHFVLLLTALALIFVRVKRAENRELAWYSAGIIAAFVAFCAILKWQMWSGRFHLPLFVLGAAVSALALKKYVPQRVVTAIAVVLVAWGLLNASMNRFRSLVPVGRWKTVYGPRALLYFSQDDLGRLAPSYIDAAETINKTDCASVGIDAYTPLTDAEIVHSPDSFLIYPIVALTHSDGRARTAWYSGVHNLTARYAEYQRHAPACVVVCLDCAKVPAKWEEYRSFPNHQVLEDAVVFTKAGK